MNEPIGARSPGGSQPHHEPALLLPVPELPAPRRWTVEDISGQFRRTLALRYLLTPEALEAEVRTFEQMAYSRALLQWHIEQVLDLTPSKRKRVYKRWRRDLGDDRARRYANFAEHLITRGTRPRWFLEELSPWQDVEIVRPPSVVGEWPSSR
jgi:hypothetical protein